MCGIALFVFIKFVHVFRLNRAWAWGVEVPSPIMLIYLFICGLMLCVVLYVIIRCTLGDTHILGGLQWGSGYEREALIHVHYPIVLYGVKTSYAESRIFSDLSRTLPYHQLPSLPANIAG